MSANISQNKGWSFLETRKMHIRLFVKLATNYYARSWLALKPRIVAFVYCSSWLRRRLAVKTSLSASKSVKLEAKIIEKVYPVYSVTVGSDWPGDMVIADDVMSLGSFKGKSLAGNGFN